MAGTLLIYFGVGLLVAALALPMMYDKIPPNGFYGFRTPRTLSDPNVWYPANRVAGRNLAVAGVIVATTALVLLAMQKSIQPRTPSFILLAVSMTALIGAVVHSFIALRRI
jgi:uncharacterized membrane protein